jgi:hypothetical protein
MRQPATLGAFIAAGLGISALPLSCRPMVGAHDLEWHLLDDSAADRVIGIAHLSARPSPGADMLRVLCAKGMLMLAAAALPTAALALGALAIIGVMLAAILTNRLSPLAAMILVPVIGAAALGLGAGVPGWILAGVTKIAPVAGMFVFAILFFGVVSDAGLLAPLVGVLRLVGRGRRISPWARRCWPC